jgi:hypothetical protein
VVGGEQQEAGGDDQDQEVESRQAEPDDRGQQAELAPMDEAVEDEHPQREGHGDGDDAAKEQRVQALAGRPSPQHEQQPGDHARIGRHHEQVAGGAHPVTGLHHRADEPARDQEAETAAEQLPRDRAAHVPLQRAVEPVAVHPVDQGEDGGYAPGCADKSARQIRRQKAGRHGHGKGRADEDSSVQPVDPHRSTIGRPEGGI